MSLLLRERQRGARCTGRRIIYTACDGVDARPHCGVASIEMVSGCACNASAAAKPRHWAKRVHDITMPSLERRDRALECREAAACSRRHTMAILVTGDLWHTGRLLTAVRKCAHFGPSSMALHTLKTLRRQLRASASLQRKKPAVAASHLHQPRTSTVRPFSRITGIT